MPPALDPHWGLPSMVEVGREETPSGVFILLSLSPDLGDGQVPEPCPLLSPGQGKEQVWGKPLHPTPEHQLGSPWYRGKWGGGKSPVWHSSLSPPPSSHQELDESPSHDPWPAEEEVGGMPPQMALDPKLGCARHGGKWRSLQWGL